MFWQPRRALFSNGCNACRYARKFATLTSDTQPHRTFDVCVIGGGHAGSEACAAAARAGAKTVLVTQDLSKIGECSCNPSIGGIGKGIMVREIDALDGLMGRVTDKAGIAFHVLNRSKGAAVWGPRAQVDRKLYKKHMQAELKSTPNLTLLEGSVSDLLIDPISSPVKNSIASGRMQGIALGTTLGLSELMLESGEIIQASQIIITTGTFLGGEIHIGILLLWPSTSDCSRIEILSIWSNERASVTQIKSISEVSRLSIGKIKDRNSCPTRKTLNRLFKASSSKGRRSPHAIQFYEFRS